MITSRFIFLKIGFRESAACFRQGMIGYLPSLFFIFVCVLFPLTMSPEIRLLQQIGPGVIWIALLLAHLLSLPRLWEEDYSDGALDQLLLAPGPLPFYLGVKILTHWFIVTVPMILLSPVMALLFHLSGYAMMILIASLLLGTPLLYFQGAMIAALCLSVQQGMLLLAILLLPLYIPIVILGSAVVDAAEKNMSFASPMALLGALLCLAMSIGPRILAFAVRTSIEYS